MAAIESKTHAITSPYWRRNLPRTAIKKKKKKGNWNSWHIFFFQLRRWRPLIFCIHFVLVTYMHPQIPRASSSLAIQTGSGKTHTGGLSDIFKTANPGISEISSSTQFFFYSNFWDFPSPVHKKNNGESTTSAGVYVRSFTLVIIRKSTSLPLEEKISGAGNASEERYPSTFTLFATSVARW